MPLSTPRGLEMGTGPEGHEHREGGGRRRGNHPGIRQWLGKKKKKKELFQIDDLTVG